MKTTIAQANDAKKYFMTRYGWALESCTLVLGDQGFRLEVVPKDATFQIGEHTEIGGIPVVVAQK